MEPDKPDRNWMARLDHWSHIEAACVILDRKRPEPTAPMGQFRELFFTDGGEPTPVLRVFVELEEAVENGELEVEEVHQSEAVIRELQEASEELKANGKLPKDWKFLPPKPKLRFDPYKTLVWAQSCGNEVHETYVALLGLSDKSLSARPDRHAPHDQEESGTDENLPGFPTPPGSKWSAVHITFTSDKAVHVRVGERSGDYSFEDMRMKNDRSKEPNKQWELLRELADHDGIKQAPEYGPSPATGPSEEEKQIATLDRRGAVKMEKERLDQRVKALKAALAKFFCIPGGEPISWHNEVVGSTKNRFWIANFQMFPPARTNVPAEDSERF